jgi:hypothetical protein
MASVHAKESEIGYFKDLVGAGWEGVAEVRRELGGRVFERQSKPSVWTPAAVGCAVGVLGTGMFKNRRSAPSLAIGAIVGSVVGLTAAGAWAARHFTRAATRRASHMVNQVRDAHWLEKNPINYA